MQIITGGGNCAEQAMVVRALLNELNVKTRRISEINIQPKKEQRQKDSEKLFAEHGNLASVFGYSHNDHVWAEFFDEEKKEWVPTDPTLGLMGLENWLRSRIGFEPWVNSYHPSIGGYGGAHCRVCIEPRWNHCREPV